MEEEIFADGVLEDDNYEVDEDIVSANCHFSQIMTCIVSNRVAFKS